MADIAELYDSYYQQDEEGKSTYNSRFGPYEVPLMEFIRITDLVTYSLEHNHLGLLWSDKKRLPDYENLVQDLRKYVKFFDKHDAESFYLLCAKKVLQEKGFVLTSHLVQPLKKEINILDFGCGDGRYFKLYTALARALEPYNVKLNVVGYEISSVGLEDFKKRALENGFSFVDDTECAVERNNLRFIYVCNRAIDSGRGCRMIKEAAHKYGAENMSENELPINISMCLFGVLSHIEDERTRVTTINNVTNITSDYFLMTCPSDKFLADPNLKITRSDGRTHFYEKTLPNGERIEIPYVTYPSLNDITFELYMAGHDVVDMHMVAAAVEKPFYASHNLQSAYHELSESAKYRSMQHNETAYHFGGVDKIGDTQLNGVSFQMIVGSGAVALWR